MPIKQLRRTAAANAFKAAFLEDAHEPGRGQMAKLNVALAKSGTAFPPDFDPRTWSAWINAKKPQIPGREKFSILDKIFAEARPDDAGSAYEAMLHDGLLDVMCAETRKKGDANLLRARAEEYFPESPLHNHLDAIETVGWTDESNGVPGRVVRGIAARRILKRIHYYWNPRSGSVYSVKDPQTRKLGALRRGIRCPDWEKLGVDEDISVEQIHRVMVALASTSVLDDEERGKRWVIDCANALFATYALHWPDYVVLLGHRLTPELASVALLHATFVSEDDSLLNDERLILRCVPRAAEWDIESVQRSLVLARLIYGAILEFAGLSRKIVECEFKRLEIEDPMQFVG